MYKDELFQIAYVGYSGSYLLGRLQLSMASNNPKLQFIKVLTG